MRRRPGMSSIMDLDQVAGSDERILSQGSIPDAMNAADLTDLDADALSRAIHAREISCREVMQAYLARIHRLDPRVNAIVNLAAHDLLVGAAGRREDEPAPGRA